MPPDASAGERKRVDAPSNVAAISCVDSLGGLTLRSDGWRHWERERDSQRERNGSHS